MNPQLTIKLAQPAQTAQPATPMSQNVPECPAESPRDPSVPVGAPSVASPPDLTDRQLAAIDLILSGRTATDAAEALGIDRRTIYRWRTEDPAFRQRLDQLRRQRCDEAADHLSASLSQALAVFDRHLKDLYAPICFRAARAVLTLAQIGKLLNPEPLPHPDPHPHPQANAGAKRSAAPDPSPGSPSPGSVRLHAQQPNFLYAPPQRMEE